MKNNNKKQQKSKQTKPQNKYTYQNIDTIVVSNRDI